LIIVIGNRNNGYKIVDKLTPLKPLNPSCGNRKFSLAKNLKLLENGKKSGQPQSSSGSYSIRLYYQMGNIVVGVAKKDYF